MATAFTLPDLGENIDSGDVVSVLVAPGDTVKPGQAVLEVETDKAVIEVPCPPGCGVFCGRSGDASTR